MDLFDIFFNLSNLASLFTLTILEIVLGVDNLVFLTILTNKLPTAQRNKARTIGLLVAMLSRLLFLFLINLTSQTKISLFNFYQINVTIESLIFGLGGAFLFYKAIHEIHQDIENGGAAANYKQKKLKSVKKQPLNTSASITFWWVISQVMIVDIIFSIDSVITAVGMTHHYTIMAIAIITSVIIMLFASKPFSEFIERHPTVKMLALSFLILIGTMLMAQSIGYKVEKGYLYFAIAFSMFVEILNIRASKAKKRKI